MERVVVLDFGGQYNQLIARRVREAGVYSELLPAGAAPERIRGAGLSGIILSGGPNSVYDKNAIACDPAVFHMGVPVLGICYGMQYIAQLLPGGAVEASDIREYGHTPIALEKHPLFEGMDIDHVWMNHNDRVSRLPAGFASIAHTKDCPNAAFANEQAGLFGIQFHAEVAHTPKGELVFRNFLRNICGCKCDYSPKNLADELRAAVRAQVGSGRVIGALSGGVDSSVAATLVHQAIGDQLACIFVDHGLLRLNEAEQVMECYKNAGIRVIAVDARKRFLDKLKNVTEPEQKRKIIGAEFISVFREEAMKLGGAEYLLQGTIYPDIIESGAGNAAVIKSHHNVGGLPEDIGFKGLVEPLRMLFKDEVRVLGEHIGLPHDMVWRQPFPGPGLAIRVMGDVTEEKLNILRQSDAILREEIKAAGLEEQVWQYFTVFTGVRSVGVMGDQRTYDYAIAIRAVTGSDAMTMEWAELPYPLLHRISARIVAEAPHVNRVVYDITSKPPGTIEWE